MLFFLGQVASRELNIPMSCIHFCETSTTTVPNACASVGSAGTDVNGMAVKVEWCSVEKNTLSLEVCACQTLGISDPIKIKFGTTNNTAGDGQEVTRLHRFSAMVLMSFQNMIWTFPKRVMLDKNLCFI